MSLALRGIELELELEERELFAAYRRRRGVRQAWLAAEVGIPQSRISDYERGARSLPRERVGELWDAVDRLAVRVGVEVGAA